MRIEQNGEMSGRQLTSEDSLTSAQYRDIAFLIYETDPFIYPALFFSEGGDSPEQNAIRILSESIQRNDDRMFCKDNLYVFGTADCIAGMILWHEGALNWKPDSLMKIAASLSVHLSERNVQKVREEYFEKYDEANETRTLSLINLCVRDIFRGKGVGSSMLEGFLADHRQQTAELCVLSANRKAIQLYQNHGFEIIRHYSGFSLSDEKPLCLELRRNAGMKS